MKALLQRVRCARVTVEQATIGAVERGLVIFLGVMRGDTPADAALLADKTVGLRIFGDAQGKMNLSLGDLLASGQAAGVLVVSQFTLAADCRKGRRPSFTQAAEPAAAEELYESFQAELRRLGVTVATGKFAAHMQVELTNDGPVTIMLDSRELGAATTA